MSEAVEDLARRYREYLAKLANELTVECVRPGWYKGTATGALFFGYSEAEVLKKYAGWKALQDSIEILE